MNAIDCPHARTITKTSASFRVRWCTACGALRFEEADGQTGSWNVPTNCYRPIKTGSENK